MAQVAKKLMEMENLVVTDNGDGTHSITYDPRKVGQLSPTGKSKRIASTLGNVSVANYTIGLNIYQKV